MSNANQLGAEMGKMQKTLQTGVLERFLTPDEITKFMHSYRANLKGPGKTKDRSIALSRPVTEEEKELVRKFFTFDKSISEMERELGMKQSSMHIKVNVIVRRLVFQNQAALGL